ncbi:MAG: NapC/NirT family cytochrome c [Candidatus Hatepunaea meridiana]|nr:NapC/NirT family cytochrome c [Candidatus Hatepunaea meridiana]
MRRLYLALINGVSANIIGRIGVSLVTAVFILFILFELLQVVGLFTNAYFGLIVYLLFPALFIIGLLLLPIGWRMYMKAGGFTLKESFTHRFDEVDIQAKILGARLLRTFGLLTIINLIFIGAVSGRALHFMESAEFCGTACHNVMNPEWTTYRQSPHARVKCVECHVGEGIGALIDSKRNGTWMMISGSLNIYKRPIPTPVHNLRPARETCEKCHWPEMFLGNRIRNIVHYKTDEASTLSYTTLMMKVGSGKEGLDKGSHWHVAARNEVRYASLDYEREQMIWVDVRQPDGTFKRYRNNSLSNLDSQHQEHLRTVDCVDCHNRATHIYEFPENAIDVRIRKGLIDRTLPFIKERALGALTSNYPDSNAAMKVIEAHVGNFYQLNYPELSSTASKKIDEAVNIIKDIYKRNIHHHMNIEWGSYPNHLGHRNSEGCFRCHNKNLVDDEGQTISMDCTLCHSILAIDESTPFKYLVDIQSDRADGSLMKVQKYLKSEFQKSME